MIVIAYKQDNTTPITLGVPYWVLDVKKQGKHILYLIKQDDDKEEWFLSSRFETVRKDVRADLLIANKKLQRENKLYRKLLRTTSYWLFPIRIKKPLFIAKFWRKIWGK